jgi:hypothetical protein
MGQLLIIISSGGYHNNTALYRREVVLSMYQLGTVPFLASFDVSEGETGIAFGVEKSEES